MDNFNTGNVESMEYMFYNCIFLQSINLDNFNTSNAENMEYMFYDFRSLTSLNVSNLLPLKSLLWQECLLIVYL